MGDMATVKREELLGRIEWLQRNLFLRSEFQITTTILSILCFALGIILLAIHAFLEERKDFTSVVEHHEVPATKISMVLIMLAIVAPVGEKLQRLYLKRLEGKAAEFEEPI